MAPVYLFACLILGGSAQGVWQNMILQLAGLLIIGWAALAPSEDPLPPGAKPLLLLAIAAVVVVTLQAVPVPADLWAHGIRARIADGYRLLGRPVPAMPVSVSPYASMATLLCSIPALAMFCAIVRLKAYSLGWLAAALLAGTVAGIVLAVVQVVGGPSSPWYLYAETNTGLGVGFFANANHMADLLVISLAFVAAIAGAARTRSVQHYRGLLVVSGALVVVIIAGIALTDSLAGYALSLPVLGAGALMVLPAASRWRGVVLAVAAVSLIASVAALATTSIGATRIGQEAATSAQSREQILRTTSRAIADFMPFGSGLGSFVRVYPLYESPDSVTTEYVIHAHNDYAEIALELGVPGIILVLLFLAWWFAAVWDVWGRGQGGPFVRAASIASAAVMIHSLVDFPLRTAAIAACFATCLALIAERRAARRQERSDLRPTRHVVIG